MAETVTVADQATSAASWSASPFPVSRSTGHGRVGLHRLLVRDTSPFADKTTRRGVVWLAARGLDARGNPPG